MLVLGQPVFSDPPGTRVGIPELTEAITHSSKELGLAHCTNSSLICFLYFGSMNYEVSLPLLQIFPLIYGIK